MIVANRRKDSMTSEEEWSLARRWRHRGDTKALGLLVERHIGLVHRIARKEFPCSQDLYDDLTQEGLTGLTIAARKFDPERRLKLTTYAAYWIRAYMMNFIVDSHGPVRTGTRRQDRRIFFRIGAARRKLERGGFEADREALAAEMGVTAEDVETFLPRLEGHDVSLDANTAHSSRGATHPLADRLPDGHASPEEVTAESRDAASARRKLHAAVAELDPRSRRILELRWLTDKPLTLREVGEQFGLSRERVRQVEFVAIQQVRKKMREADEA